MDIFILKLVYSERLHFTGNLSKKNTSYHNYFVTSWDKRTILTEMEENAPIAVETTNILRLQYYLLAPDEIIFFDWLVVKQISFKYVQFSYSEKRIEEETHIKRSRQEKIEEKFTQLGFLETEVKLNKRISSHVRYFYVNLTTLYKLDILSSIIRQGTDYFHQWLDYLYYHAARQIDISKGITPKNFKLHHEIVEDIYKSLNEIYKNRIQMYNEGKLTDSKKPPRRKTVVQLPRNVSLEGDLFRMSKTYDSNTIQKAFLAYTDAVLKGEIQVKAFMPYFLSPKDPLKPYSVMEKFLDIFIKNYSYKANDA